MFFEILVVTESCLPPWLSFRMFLPLLPSPILVCSSTLLLFMRYTFVRAALAFPKYECSNAVFDIAQGSPAKRTTLATFNCLLVQRNRFI